MKPNPTPVPIDPLQTILLELDLTTLSRELAAALRQAETSKPAYSEFLHTALQIEQTARQERNIQRRLHRSKLGPTICLSEFDFAARPQLSPAVVRELATCRFVDEGRNVILVGRSSTGKTTIAKILGHAVCDRGLSVYYATMTDMLSTLHAAKADATYRKVFRRLSSPALLVIDDAGFATLDRDNTSELFRLVCARYRRSTIVVTNLPFKRWGEFMASPEQAVAIADRLIDNATILRFSGPPFRKPRDISGAPLDGE